MVNEICVRQVVSPVVPGGVWQTGERGGAEGFGEAGGDFPVVISRSSGRSYCRRTWFMVYTTSSDRI